MFFRERCILFGRYRNTVQWADGTTAFYYKVQPKAVYDPRQCFSMLLHGETFLRFNYCYVTNYRKIGGLLCERHISVSGREGNSHSSQIHINENITFSIMTRFIMCPLGHVTHQFLSCDAHSACWASEETSHFECHSPLSPFPPMFICVNDLNRIPYTMVCDHQIDCTDSSDENICDFPDCSIDSFDCGLKDVSLKFEY